MGKEEISRTAPYCDIVLMIYAAIGQHEQNFSMTSALHCYPLLLLYPSHLSNKACENKNLEFGHFNKISVNLQVNIFRERSVIQSLINKFYGFFRSDIGFRLKDEKGGLVFLNSNFWSWGT